MSRALARQKPQDWIYCTYLVHIGGGKGLQRG